MRMRLLCIVMAVGVIGVGIQIRTTNAARPVAWAQEESPYKSWQYLDAEILLSPENPIGGIVMGRYRTPDTFAKVCTFYFDKVRPYSKGTETFERLAHAMRIDSGVTRVMFNEDTEERPATQHCTFIRREVTRTVYVSISRAVKEPMTYITLFADER